MSATAERRLRLVLWPAAAAVGVAAEWVSWEQLGAARELVDLGVPCDELAEVADSVVVRAGARANPRAASAAEVTELLRSVW